MMSEVYLRTVPQLLQEGVDNGTYKVYGSIIRHCETGRIAAHLQETSSVIQKTGLQSLNTLGLTSVALSAVGIGIMVAGFTILAMKIEEVKQALHDIAGKLDVLDQKLDRITQDAIDADFVELRALAKGMDEAWQLEDSRRAEQQWHDIAQKALSLQTRFEWRADRILTGEAPNYELANPMLDAIAFSSGIRVSALAACNETTAAIAAASDGARTIERLTGGIGVADLVERSIEAVPQPPGSVDWALALAAANEAARPVVRQYRDREAATATRAEPLALLARKGIHPRDWLAAAREENEAPLLLMLVDTAD